MCNTGNDIYIITKNSALWKRIGETENNKITN